MTNPFHTLRTEQDRLDIVMRANADTLRAIIRLPRDDLQATVRQAAERRLRKLTRNTLIAAALKPR